MINLGEFNADLSRFKYVVDRDRSNLVKKVATECFTRIVKRTPVDTGALRKDWDLRVNKYHAVIENGMSYAARIENGYSKKAPEGMVAITVAELKLWNPEI